MADITKDGWYKRLVAKAELNKAKSNHIEEIREEIKVTKPKRAVTPPSERVSPSLAQMQADSMDRLRKRALPPIRRGYGESETR